ncbi:putative ATP/GTP binding protein [Catenulispora acidiphila DSM 44928]|uniref:Putative ATP/GTP binding protein n=1 Tax=Catenulispora acidiphila (strain DSM 44928 / JCM 14897 / NBRC 102108 / NRRL B-24433 / ID139908) TaxID=479433 RepID=C7PVN0_CATAD|nr:putative ATP/GTP binding protein [Catenulispora acidiphila DSM 44928]
MAAAFTATGVPQVQVLFGLGGVGKTSVAVEYAYRFADSYGIVWQFSAEHPESLDGQIGELAAHLGLLVPPTTDDAAGSLRSHLVNADRPWLLVLDNVVDDAVVHRLVPAAGPGHVVVTSQRATWPGRARVREVPVLDRDVAIKYLLSAADSSDVAASGLLVDALGGLPLALAHAAAFLRVTGRPVQFYLDKLSAMLVRPGRGKAVARTWSAAIGQLGSAGSPAMALLRVLACFAPDAIPVRLLFPDDAPVPEGLSADVADQLAALADDGLAVDDALIALREFSLVGSPVGDGVVSIHRLVQAATLEAMSPEEQSAWRQAATALVVRATPDDPNLPETWPAFTALLRHIEQVVPAEHDCYLRAADHLGAVGNYRAAVAMARRSLEARARRQGPDAPETLAARQSTAQWTGHAGDFEGARDQCADLLPIRERLLGVEHPDTLSTRSVLAFWTARAGSYAAARNQGIDLLSIRERVLGIEHPDTLLTRSNLAGWTGNAGDPAGARDQFADLLPRYQHVLGDEHPVTLITRTHLARWVGEAGDPAGARDRFADVLPIRERVFGAEHPDTLHVRANLARWTGKAGAAAEARDQYAVLLPLFERVLGPEHPATLTNRRNLAHWTGKAGDAHGAREQLVALLPLHQRVLGPEHVSTLHARHNLARWTKNAGDNAGARDQFTDLLPIRERVLGSEHLDTVKTRNGLASCITETERVPGATE